MADDPATPSPPTPAELEAGAGIYIPRKPSDRSWKLQTAIGITPKKLGSMISALFDGDTIEFLGFAEELLVRDSHYSSQVLVLVNTVAATEWVPTGPEGPIFDAIREHLIEGGVWKKLCKGLLDGETKGYACVEMFWRVGPQGTIWAPAKVKWVDPRNFGYDGDQIMIRDVQSPNDITKFKEIPPYTMAVYETSRKSGLPYRNGLALPCSVMHLFKSFSFKDWVQFSAIFGMPIRMAQYNPGSKDEDIQALQKAVDELGHFASAVFPANAKVELASANTQGNGEAFSNLIETCNREMSKVINGQTMTSDDGSSQSQAKIHDIVRHDISEGVAEDLGEVLTNCVVRPFVALNFGEKVADQYGVSPKFDDSDDAEKTARAMETYFGAGLEVSEVEARAKMGFKTPDDGDMVLSSGGRRPYRATVDEPELAPDPDPEPEPEPDPDPEPEPEE